MSDPNPSATGLQIPADTQAKFPALLAMIQSSESMNDEERQYWINILPIMSEEQLKNLEDILSSEKTQLAAIDAKYSKEISNVSNAVTVAAVEERIKSKKMQRQKAEADASTKEQQKEEELLAQIQSF
jgi:hypothetical protein